MFRRQDLGVTSPGDAKRTTAHPSFWCLGWRVGKSMLRLGHIEPIAFSFYFFPNIQGYLLIERLLPRKYRKYFICFYTSVVALLYIWTVASATRYSIETQNAAPFGLFVKYAKWCDSHTLQFYEHILGPQHDRMFPFRNVRKFCRVTRQRLDRKTF